MPLVDSNDQSVSDISEAFHYSALRELVACSHFDIISGDYGLPCHLRYCL